MMWCGYVKGWGMIECELIGGPQDGQQVPIPEEQDKYKVAFVESVLTPSLPVYSDSLIVLPMPNIHVHVYERYKENLFKYAGRER